jgi:hypothetical protein
MSIDTSIVTQNFNGESIKQIPTEREPAEFSIVFLNAISNLDLTRKKRRAV